MISVKELWKPERSSTPTSVADDVKFPGICSAALFTRVVSSGRELREISAFFLFHLLLWGAFNELPEIIWLSEGSMHWATWAVHRGLDTWTEEHRKWVTREGNYWNEGKIRRDAYLVKTWFETKQNKPVKLRETPKISAYRCSLGGNGRYIFPVNISERQFNSWSYSELWQNNWISKFKDEKEITLKLKVLLLHQCSLGDHWTGLCIRERIISTGTCDKQDVSAHFLPQDVSFLKWREKREFGRDLLNE